MRWLALVCLAAAGCLGFSPENPGGIDAAVDSAPPGSFRKAITIAAGAVAEPLIDFPLYVEIAGDADLAARAESDASDIHFTDAGGAALDHEIELWSPDTGDLVAWVRVPSLASDADTTVELRYGDPESGAAANPPGVWSDGFEVVFHLNNDPAGAIVDSLQQHVGTADPSMDGKNLVAARLGLGLQLDGVDDEIDFDNPIVGVSSHTISAWVSQEVSGNNEALVVLGTGGTTNRSRFIHSRFDNGDIATGFFANDRETGSDIQGLGFVLVHWTYDSDSGDSRVYVDGALVDQFTFAVPANTEGAEGRIGNAPALFGMNMGLNGTIDEVRIASVSRTAGWIAAEYANQSDPASFYTVGDEQALP